MSRPRLDAIEIAAGLRRVGLDRKSHVIVHASLRSFGYVEGGAASVVEALTTVCGTVVMMAGSNELTKLPAPPRLMRPNNAYYNSPTWEAFDKAVATATPYRPDLPVSRWLGQVAEEMRRHPGSVRGPHPLLSFVAVGECAFDVIAGERLDHPLGAIERLADLGGDVLLLGVDHTSNSAIHLAEQRFGRGHFYRYARDSSGLWIELPNVSGESHRFNEIEPYLRGATTHSTIGTCLARRVPVAEVLATATQVMTTNPGAMLCDDPDCRCVAALRQYESRCR